MILKDRVKVNTDTSGTGILTLGSTYSGFQDFSALGTGVIKTYYSLVNGVNWETGEGTYNSTSGTLSRDQVFESSSTGSLINLSSSSTVFVTYPSKTSVYLNSSTTPSSGQYLVANNDRSFSAQNLTASDVKNPLSITYTLNSTNSTVVDSTTGNAIKYLIKAEYGSDTQLQESLIISKSNSVYITIYGQLYTSPQPLISVDSSSTSGIINLSVAATSSGTVINLYKISI
jgi:hypothetical protein